MKPSKIQLVILAIGLVLTACSIKTDANDEAVVFQATDSSIPDLDNPKPDKAIALNVENELASAQALSVSNLDELLQYYSPEKQVFEVNANQEILFEGAKGTKVYIPANSLVFEDGTRPTSPVIIQLKEFYGFTDLISESLTTKSESSLIESGGTVHITAFSEGKLLKMKAGEQFALYFPREGLKEGMELFYGNRDANGNMNWTVPEVRDSSFGADQMSSQQTNSANTSGMTSPTVRILDYTTSLANIDLRWELANSDQNVFDYFNDNFTGPSDVLSNLCALNATAELELTLTEAGKVKEIYFVGHSLGELNHYITSFFKNMPNIEMSTMSPYATNTKLRISIGAMINYNDDNFKESFENRYRDFKNKAFTKVDQSELEYYILAASEFGWINCDRFIRSEEEKVNFIVKSSAPNNTKVMLAFLDINSMLQSTVRDGQAVFSNIPKNEAVKVIGLSVSKQQPLMAQFQTVTGDQTVDLHAYKPFSINDLSMLLEEQ